MMKLHNRTPDVENLLQVLRCKVPARPTLFELFMNDPLYETMTGKTMPSDYHSLDYLRFRVDAFAAAGYDYCTTHGSALGFPTDVRDRKSTISLNEGYVITDEASFDAYAWPNPDAFSYDNLKKIAPYLPGKMKLMVMGPGGVLENVTSLVGYDNLCIMLYENPALAQRVFDEVGARLLRHYEIASQFDSVAVLMSNDDWGFNTQTFLSPAHMRQYVFPWHKKIVDAAHAAGKPIILHSCGCFRDIMQDVVDMGYDGKHSYEDVIQPVEEMYEQWNGKIALLGGMDLDFVVRRSEAEITARAKAMLERAATRGGYALGTGNSVPEYIPHAHYFAMLRAALEA